MKVLSLEYAKGKYDNPLDGFNHPFHKVKDSNKTLPICLAGVNGSGKSKLLEVLSDIFFYLDHLYSDDGYDERTELQFVLEYLIESPEKKLVRISQKEERGIPTLELINSKTKRLITNKAVAKNLLPKFVVAYSSGDNETLSKRYEDTYMEYSEAVTDLEKNPSGTDVPDTRLVFLDYNVNSYVFIANSRRLSESHPSWNVTLML